MISTTLALRGSEVRVQGSILASPALYKDEQNGAPHQLWVGWQSGGVGEPSGARSLEALSCGEFGVASRVESSGCRVESTGLRVGGVGTREDARWQTRGLRGDHSRGKGYVETTARETLPSTKAVRGERASTR